MLFTTLLLLTLLPVCHTVCTSSTGCYPPVQNIATKQNSLTISATSTCGQEAPELSCPLLSATIGDFSQCYNCTADEYAPSMAVDGNSGTWWQGSNDVMDVTLQLDLSGPVLLSESSLLWYSPRARSMLLEYSTDNAVSWAVYQYYSPSCQIDFLLPPTSNPEDTSLGTAAVCDNTQSNINPYFGGVISFSPAARIEGGTTNFSTLALDYFLITNLRARMLSFNRAVGVIDEGYSHAVSEWRVYGSCFCNGHGDACDVTAPSTCVCGHNTEGDRCERCLPLFNNKLYQQGTLARANACEECECNSHATSCVYDSSVGSGVCENCEDNTSGDRCDSCLPFFYRDPFLLLTDPSICRPCACVTEGTADDGGCQVSTGDCSCKRNVFGTQCDQCKLGFYNLTSQPDGCQACSCHNTGSQSITCDLDSGQCDCKENTEGTQCDSCKDGYYGLPAGDGGDCVACGCDLGGASSPVCDKETGGCTCLPNFSGSKCDAVAPGYFLPAPDHLLFEAEGGNLTQVDVPGYEGLNTQLAFTGEGLVRVERGDRLELSISVPHFLDYIPILRYFSLQTGAVIFEIILMNDFERCQVDNRVQSAVLNNSDSYIAFLPTCLQESPTYYTISLTPADATLWVDSVVLVPNHTLSPVYSQLTPPQQDEVEDCTRSYYSLASSPPSCTQTLFSIFASFYQTALPCSCTSLYSTSDECAPFGGQCPCRGGVTNRDCTSCIPGYHSISTLGCTPCACDVTGARLLPCDSSTGQCVCKIGVTGLACDSCQPGYYGLEDTGCQTCDCTEFSSSNECNNSGQCSCLQGVTGDKCSACRQGYFELSVTGCQACECSEETAESVECSEAGVCSCVNGFSGDKCGLCAAGSYVTPGPTGPVCEECKCYNQASLCSNLTRGYRESQLISNYSSCQSFLSEFITDCTMDWEVEDGFYLQLAVNPYITFIITSPTQVYWLAPSDPFLGNRSLSYGYDIVLSVFSEDLVDELRFLGPQPDIIMEGSFISDQLVSSFPAEVSSSPGNPFSIPLLESSWKVDDIYGPVATYSQLIQVLSNLTSLRIRARYSEATAARTSMEYFIMETLVEDSTAEGLVVEECECPAAYTGTSCSSCSSGYYRPSLNPVDTCVSCECNGHTGLCDPITGRCQSCQHNTTGDSCQTCVDGFFGDATAGTPSDCQLCPCPLTTQSVSPTCYLQQDGLPTCDSCAVGYAGRTCERCEDGYFGRPTLPGSRCTTCECSGNIDLSLTGNCNTTTGECVQCINNTAGYECELCAPGYYGNALLDECVPCQCNTQGRVDNECNSSSGVCLCKQHVIGGQCDMCETGYWGLHLGLSQGCISCDCCSNGSLSRACNTSTGVCSCKENIGGERDIKCCACSSNAFNFTDSACDLCACDVGGSVTESCEQQTGVCRCDTGVEGDKCDTCTFGYTGTPPDCGKCPQCFDDWLALIQTEATTISGLNFLADFLLYSYLPLTIHNITTLINQLNTQLFRAAYLAGSSNLSYSELSGLEATLAVLSQNLTDLDDLLNVIVIPLNKTRVNIIYSMQFDGNVVLETGEQINAALLMAELVALNDSVEEAKRLMISIIHMIANENTRILISQARIDTSKERVTAYTNVSMHVLNQLEIVSNKTAMFCAEYESNRNLLSSIQQKEVILADKLNATKSRIDTATRLSVTTENMTSEARMSASEKASRAEDSLNSVRILHNISDNTLNQSQSVFNDALAVHDTSIQTSVLADLTQELQSDNITTLQFLQESGELTMDILTDTLAVTGADPSKAQQLSSQINAQVVPAEVVYRIGREANYSLEQARVANEVANQAKQAANNASNVLFGIVSNINMTQVTQSMTTNVSIESAKNALLSADEAVREFYEETGELVETSEEIFSLTSDVGRINGELNDKFNESTIAATSAVNQCFLACEIATALNGTIEFAVNVTDGLSDGLSFKEDFVAESFNKLNSLLNATKSLMEEVSSVQLSELRELMEDLEDERREIEALKEEAREVEMQISSVENNINGLAELYATCPVC